jgi:hypothetical protein
MSGGIPLLSGKQTLLSMIVNACNELGITAPTQIFGNADPQIVQLLALANREAKELFNAGFGREGWQVLNKTYTFTINTASGLTGTFTAGSPIVTNISPNTSAITTSMQPYATTYIPVDTTVTAINSSTQITMSANAKASGTGVSFFCGQVAYNLPSDIDHFITQTFWDRNFRWQLLGPLNAQEWQVLKSGISPTGPRRRFRIVGNQFYIDPVPGFSTSDNGAIEAFEYYSNGWCQSAGGTSGTPQTQFLADTDNYCLDDETLTLGLIWRYRSAKGLPYAQEKEMYDNLVQRVQARDGAARNLPLNASSSGVRILNSQNVPDTGFGS